MKRTSFTAKWLSCAAPLTILTGLSLGFTLPMLGQRGAPGAPPPPLNAHAQAPQDLTGYWVSIVTEDWRYRMIVADPGDTASVPLNQEGVKVAKAWDMAKDKANKADACKPFGAAGLMRIPGRLHITWQDDNTLKVETDSGTQTRLFHFVQNPMMATAPHEAPSWQGYSIASWQGLAPRNARPAPGAMAGSKKEGYLQVNTTNLKPGYLRTNGVPYSADTHLLEYYDSFKEPNGDQWLVITTVVNDPTYLQGPFVTSTHFKKLADNSGWDPTPCQIGVAR